ncbi:glycosyltransferase family 2 protein [Magnetospirillum fulvum]|uniref:Glycosyltransferase, GT2 family n=1 Tax=Magnetospirillum fulvum TaxID=1082 RepID=A0A1H6H801_MAGFU|nr:glycosyltransferase [Magnetospirillum fulvum]SEH30220.1 Glycosyltransferase, GT2 family [Magnetospirillum fulvum]
MTVAEAQLAVVVGTYNRLDQLRALLDSIERQSHTPYEVHVSDAGSTDGTVEWLREMADRDARIRPYFEQERRGQAAALNAVFATLSTPWVCWLSDDNIVVEGGLDIAVAALAADASLGMVGLKVRDLRGPFTAAPYIGGITGTGILNINQGMLPTRLLQDLGGFSTEFRDYGIDADLTTRVLLAGRGVAMTRQVCIHHNRNWPEQGSPGGERMAALNHRYKALYMRTYGPLLGRDTVWLLRRAAWKCLRMVMAGRLSLDNPRPVLGRLVRDWHNMITGRFIDLRAELANGDRPLHLVQRCPTRWCGAANTPPLSP